VTDVDQLLLEELRTANLIAFAQLRSHPKLIELIGERLQVDHDSGRPFGYPGRLYTPGQLDPTPPDGFDYGEGCPARDVSGHYQCTWRTADHFDRPHVAGNGHVVLAVWDL
jgi:hypothetical protein